MGVGGAGHFRTHGLFCRYPGLGKQGKSLLTLTAMLSWRSTEFLTFLAQLEMRDVLDFDVKF